MFLQKKIYMRRDKKKWCIVRLYKFKGDMQRAYKGLSPKDTHHFKVRGCHLAYSKMNVSKRGNRNYSGETGTILLSLKDCGAGIVTHEILHGIFWAHNHTFSKEQYPFTITDMKHEESILQDFTYAVTQFYQWYWKVENKLR